jgi:crotonobetainyl-CoA:carnitine CoA-transferase CaiB-like acyl-CoA transferase
MGILDQQKVLDLTDEKGQLCARLLADMGAQVTCILPPGKDPPRYLPDSFQLYPGLDLEKKRDQQILRHLAKNSDFVIESFSPGYLDSRRLGYTELSRINPRVIMTSITSYGQSGPYRDYRSSDLIASAMGGQAWVCGEPDKPPLKPFGPQAYYTASLFAANGILLAHRLRHTTGRGQYIDISIHECVAATLDHVLVRYFAEGIIARRQGSLYWNKGFRVFPCRDGYILLSLFLNWNTLVDWLDSEGQAEDLKTEKWLNEDERWRNIDHIIGVLERWTRRHSVDELVELGQLMRFPWARVATIPDLVKNPQLEQREFFTRSPDSETGKIYCYPGNPLKTTAAGKEPP